MSITEPLTPPTLTQLFNAALQARDMGEILERLKPVIERLNAYDASWTEELPNGDSWILMEGPGRPGDRQPRPKPKGLIGGIVDGIG